MPEWGAESVVIVEIDQPFCSREWGDFFQSPTPASGCHAVLGVDAVRKCFQTRATCPVPDDYDPETLVLRFGRNQAGLAQYGHVIPSLVSIDTSPGSINLGGMDRDMKALGQREVVNLVLEDHKHSDVILDKYRLERISGDAQESAVGYDPYERGTFWGKWLARNPYHSNYLLRIREGTLGQDLSAMRVRTYVIDRIEGPSEGRVRIVAKDLFSRIEASKAVAPTASQGELAAAITGSPGTFDVSPVGIGSDYLAAGYVAIGDEIIQYTRSGDTFTVVARGALNTESADHEEEDLVQQVLQFTSMRAHDIVHELLCNYTALGNAGSPTGSPFIDKDAWDTAASELDELYTARIGRPEPVLDLIGELSETAGFSLWFDVETGMIEFRALRAAASVATIDDDKYILDAPIALKPQIERRASQVWVYYAQINPMEDLEDRRNYRSRFVTPDLDAEGEQQYGTPAIREVFSRWIPQFGRDLAEGTSERLLAMFRDPPVEAQFSLDAGRLSEIGLADYVTLNTADSQDDTGDVADTQHAIIELERGEFTLGVRSQSVTFPDPAEAGDERVIHIENNDYNLTLREIHDLIFTAPVGGSPTGEVVRFYVDAGVLVGSVSTATPSLDTGEWPDGVVIYVVVLGSVKGKGGAGGAGGSHGSLNGQSGGAGGGALKVRYPIILMGTGEIYAGSGGGGGGGAHTPNLGGSTWGGGGGGGGGGIDGGAAGAGGAGNQATGASGSAGSEDTGGSGGNGAERFPPDQVAGDGGAGGGIASAGSAGGSGTGGAGQGSGGSGGAAGYAIDGVSLVTFASPDELDIQGSQIN